jgi:hypothetical protein
MGKKKDKTAEEKLASQNAKKGKVMEVSPLKRFDQRYIIFTRGKQPLYIWVSSFVDVLFIMRGTVALDPQLSLPLICLQVLGKTVDEKIKKKEKKEKKGKKSKKEKGSVKDAAEGGTSVEAAAENSQGKSASIDAAENSARKKQKKEKKSKKENLKKEKRKRGPSQPTDGDDVHAPASAPEPEPERERPAKKLKKEKEPKDVGGYSSGGGEGSGREGTAAKAFQRVKAEEWLGKKGSWDNSYVGTFGTDGWGFKAQQVLGQVRGKDFRHEKTKKKRGSYRGGAIDVGARCSYKFDSDED